MTRRRHPLHRPAPAGDRGQPAHPGVHRPRRLLRPAPPARPLTGIAQDQQISLGPLTEPQLRDCIEQPAGRSASISRTAWSIASSGTLAATRASCRCSNTPSKGPGRTAARSGVRGTTALLTHAAYETAGRVEGAIAGKADAVYGKLTDAQKDAARRLFVNLVTPGEGQADTRAIARVPDDPMIEQVVAAFSDRDQRLLVTGHDPVRGRLAEVSHEALIRNWGELRRWIHDNRQLLLTRDRIAADMQRWWDKSKTRRIAAAAGNRLEEGRSSSKTMATSRSTTCDLTSSAPWTSIRTTSRRRRTKSAAIDGCLALGPSLLRFCLPARAGLAGSPGIRRPKPIGKQGSPRIKASSPQHSEPLRAMRKRGLRKQRAAARDAERARTEARKALAQESRALAALAQGETRAGNAVNGMLLALRGMPIADAEEPRPVVTETRQALVDATLARQEQLVLRGHEMGSTRRRSRRMARAS